MCILTYVFVYEDNLEFSFSLSVVKMYFSKTCFCVFVDDEPLAAG